MSGRLVLVPVACFDQRAAASIAYAWRIPASERRALHVAIDTDELFRLGGSWMAAELGCPLHTVENDGGVARTIGRVVEYELDSGFSEVVVVVGRLGLRRRLHRLLHHRTADRIGAVIASIPGALAAVTTVATT